MINPCKGCTAETGRIIGCHASCDKYKIFKSSLEELNSRIRATKSLNNDYFEARHLDARNIVKQV